MQQSKAHTVRFLVNAYLTVVTSYVCTLDFENWKRSPLD